MIKITKLKDDTKFKKTNLFFKILYQIKLLWDDRICLVGIKFHQWAKFLNV